MDIIGEIFPRQDYYIAISIGFASIQYLLDRGLIDHDRNIIFGRVWNVTGMWLPDIQAVYKNLHTIMAAVRGISLFYRGPKKC